jgi:DNA mismatch repair protein MutS
VNQCRTLFATHYHELTVLQDTLCGLVNANVKVREWKNDIIFMHEVVLGAADRSYGVQVARLAGLPESVIKRAKHLLETLENHKQKQEQLPLFAVASEPVTEPEEDALQAYLDTINPDNLSPKEALDIIYKIKELS